MNTKDFIRLDIPLGEATRRATDFVSQFILSGGDKTRLEEELKAIVENPALFAEDPMRKELAQAIANAPRRPAPNRSNTANGAKGSSMRPSCKWKKRACCRSRLRER